MVNKDDNSINYDKILEELGELNEFYSRLDEIYNEPFKSEEGQTVINEIKEILFSEREKKEKIKKVQELKVNDFFGNVQTIVVNKKDDPSFDKLGEYLDYLSKRNDIKDIIYTSMFKDKLLELEGQDFFDSFYSTKNKNKKVKEEINKIVEDDKKDSSDIKYEDTKEQIITETRDCYRIIIGEKAPNLTMDLKEQIERFIELQTKLSSVSTFFKKLFAKSYNEKITELETVKENIKNMKKINKNNRLEESYENIKDMLNSLDKKSIEEIISYFERLLSAFKGLFIVNRNQIPIRIKEDDSYTPIKNYSDHELQDFSICEFHGKDYPTDYPENMKKCIEKNNLLLEQINYFEKIVKIMKKSTKKSTEE